MAKLIKNNIIRYVGNVKRNTFDHTHGRTFTAPLNKVIPILNFHCLPGDYVGKLKTNALIRSIPLNAPLMAELLVKMAYVFIPYRLLWTGWETFITKGLSGDTSQIWPHAKLVTTIDNEIRTLADFLRIPAGTAVGTDVLVSILDFRAYDLFWNDWMRPTNIVDPVALSLAGGEDTTSNTDLLPSFWANDYLTSAFLSPQAGTGVEINLGTSAPIVASGPMTATTNNQSITFDDGAASNFGIANDASGYVSNPWGVANSVVTYKFGSNVGAEIAASEAEANLTADLSAASAVSIQELRQLSALQRWREKAMKVGLGAMGYYSSLISGFFGLVPADSRLQRPEIVGVFKSSLVFSEVLQTSQTVDQETPLATMGGHGITGMSSGNVSYAAQEHGILMGVMWFQTPSLYQNGLPRDFVRDQAISYAFPEFGLVGEQTVFNREAFLQPASVVTPDFANGDPWGYQRQYADYMETQSSTHGQMRTVYDYWNLTRQFSSLPLLDEAFVTNDIDQRAWVVTDPDLSDPLLIQMVHDMYVMRALPRFDEEYTLK